MKKVVLGLALCAVAFACNSSKTSSVSDATKATPKSDCCAAGKTDCAGSTCTDKKECTGTCPVTGKTIN
jgi:hypothetical protein